MSTAVLKRMLVSWRALSLALNGAIRCDPFRFISQISRDDVFVCVWLILLVFFSIPAWNDYPQWTGVHLHTCMINIYIYMI